MEWLNYHHLLYFRTVVREGGVAAAARKLRLAHPTVSGQIHALEDALGVKLFARSGRRLVLTDDGRLVYRYAEEIFSLGGELLDAIRGRPTGRPLRLDVGIADVLPKLVVHELLQPVRHLEQPVRLVCREDKPDRLLAALSLHELDVILADTPVPPGSTVRVYSHVLGACGVTFLATPALAAARGPDFPACLDGAPVLLPTDNTHLRRALEPWFQRVGVHPQVVAEFEDAALMKVFGADGMGVFPVATIIADVVMRQDGLVEVGRPEGVVERFYALTAERRLKHPAVVAICESARQELFA